MTDNSNPVARRAFVTGLGVGAVALGAATAARADAPPHTQWQPSHEPQDNWMDLPGRHRMVFDAISPKGAGGALTFANNYLVANKEGYKLEASDLANIIVLRHFATPFGYNDAMWKKYGAVWGKMLKFDDPKTKKIALRNVLMSVPPGETGPDAVSIPMLVDKKVHFAICGAATHFLAGAMAKKTKGKADEIEKELAANLIANAHMVPAGIVAVNRAQERGYAFAYVG